MTDHEASGTVPLALVTGAARRIGRALAISLAEAGFDIAVHYGRSEDEARDTVSEIRQLGRNAEAFPADLEKVDEAAQLMQAVQDKMGSPSILINSASLYEYDTAQTFTPLDFDRHMAVNARSPLQLIQLMIAGLEEGVEGAVINILDQKLFNDNPDFFSYTMSKRVLHEATIMMARSPDVPCRINAIAPGLTLISGDQTQEHFEKVHKMTPLNRGATPEDLARTVLFLINSPAITGEVISVDCGMRFVPGTGEVMFFDTSGRDMTSKGKGSG